MAVNPLVAKGVPYGLMSRQCGFQYELYMAFRKAGVHTSGGDHARDVSRCSRGRRYVMRATPIGGLVFGLVGGSIVFALQILLTPANAIIFSLPIALLVGIALGLALRRAQPVIGAARDAILSATLAGVLLFLGMVLGGIVYLALPATQAYYHLIDEGKSVQAPLNSYLAQDYVGPCSGIFGLIDGALILGSSQLIAARRKRA